ncbi:MAG: nucleotidyltransferase domain-containing protein [Acidobacteria bacterium]|nr:nucleotidyltransferase domain-containing protein [Acidobacteriota bacterium]
MKVLGTSPLARAVARCASTRREVAAAYVFGSVATGRTRADSDVDVAVLLARPLPPNRSLRYQLKLMADLGSALHRSDVDLVLLNDASPLLAHRVLSKGRLVFERSRSARVRFQVRTASRYADVIPMYETHIRYLKRQAQAGRPRG